jgi:hypothetical protein
MSTITKLNAGMSVYVSDLRPMPERTDGSVTIDFQSSGQMWASFSVHVRVEEARALAEALTSAADAAEYAETIGRPNRIKAGADGGAFSSTEDDA